MRFALLALLLAMAAGAGMADGNLVLNPSFDQVDESGLPLHWTQLAGEPIELRHKGGHVGMEYVHFYDSKPDAGVSLESNHVPARPGGTYRLSAWTRSDDACQPGIYIQFHDELGERIHEVHERYPCPTSGFAPFAVSAVAPEGAVTVSALLYAYIGDVGEFDFDDVELTVEGGRAPYLVTEWGLEDVPSYATGRQVTVVGAALHDRVLAHAGGKAVVDIGSRRELFVDGFMLDGLAGDARRILHSPVPRNVAIAFDAPWEGETSFYVTVMPDEGVVRLYYRGSDQEATHQHTCYAESPDGIEFTRPTLGLCEVAGSKENNVIWTGEGVHNFAPFKDTSPGCKPEERYKALAGGPLVALASPDGIHWSLMREEPVITEGAFDSQNLAFYDPLRGKYVCFLRDFADGVRTIRTCTSDDFLNWTTPEWVSYGSAPREHLYTNAITPYFRAPHIYLGFPKRFVPERKKIPEHPDQGLSDGVFMSSRDGLNFERWREAFIRPGPDPNNWTERNIGTAYGMVQTSDTELSLYWVENYRHPTCRLRRGTLRLDGFVSVHAGAGGGEMLTRPFVFQGSSLEVNYATSVAGSMRFELCDENGDPIPGFSLGDSEVLFGDEIAHAVQWSGLPPLTELAGTPVRLRVRMRDADLYSLKFGASG